MEMQCFFPSPFHGWLLVFSFENTKLIKFETDLMGCICDTGTSKQVVLELYQAFNQYSFMNK